jgi:hypothetical protein
LRHERGPRIEATPGRAKASGTRTSSKTSSEVTEARSEALRWMRGAEKPFVSVGTTNPRMPSSVRAHTTATSAIEPLVIHIFEPLITQSEPSRWAWVFIEAGSEPESASVSPKHPMASPAAIRGSHSCFCSSDPNFQIGNMASEPCTDTKLRIPESPASSSRQASP